MFQAGAAQYGIDQPTVPVYRPGKARAIPATTPLTNRRVVLSVVGTGTSPTRRLAGRLYLNARYDAPVVVTLQRRERAGGWRTIESGEGADFAFRTAPVIVGAVRLVVVGQAVGRCVLSAGGPRRRG